jgi:hypothetical protein
MPTEYGRLGRYVYLLLNPHQCDHVMPAKSFTPSLRYSSRLGVSRLYFLEVLLLLFKIVAQLHNNTYVKKNAITACLPTFIPFVKAIALNYKKISLKACLTLILKPASSV